MTGFTLTAGLTIDSNYCQYNLGTGSQTKSLRHKESVTLTYNGDPTSGQGDICGYIFQGGTGSFGENYELTVTPITYNISDCAVTVEYQAFISVSLNPTKVYDCNNPAMTYKTDKKHLRVSFRAKTASNSKIVFKISAIDLYASGVSGLESTIKPILLAGMLVVLKLLF